MRDVGIHDRTRAMLAYAYDESLREDPKKPRIGMMSQKPLGSSWVDTLRNTTIDETKMWR